MLIAELEFGSTKLRKLELSSLFVRRLGVAKWVDWGLDGLGE